jgi:hypothetical protein
LPSGLACKMGAEDNKGFGMYCSIYKHWETCRTFFKLTMIVVCKELLTLRGNVNAHKTTILPNVLKRPTYGLMLILLQTFWM